MNSLKTDVAIHGNSLGAVAAALAIAPYNLQLSFPVLAGQVGGQLTAQGVSAPDEHQYIETVASRRYHTLRQRIRNYYITNHNAPPVMADSVLGENLPLNPGNGWVSRLCHNPSVASGIILDWLADSLPASSLVGALDTVEAQYHIDATDDGSLLPIYDIPYIIGAESQTITHEPHAPIRARRGEIQSFTYPIFVAYHPNENHTIPQPPDYYQNRHRYSLSFIGHDGVKRSYKMFEDGTKGEPPFWTYRRLHDGQLLGGKDIAMINWHSNDFTDGDILRATGTDQQKMLHAARNLSWGFLYWLQTDCPRDDGGTGYPELKPIWGGLAASPYIRESRRIIPKRRVVETDIGAYTNPDARAVNMPDSVGIGWYHMDIHACVGNPSKSLYLPTKPFQIPLGALIPRDGGSVIAGCKNIGTTHLTNGAYRVHHVEWAVGEAAGTLIGFCLQQGLTPTDIYNDSWQIWRLQYALVRSGIPIFWTTDVLYDDPLFVPSQLLLVRGILRENANRAYQLSIKPDEKLGDDFDMRHLRRLVEKLGADSTAITEEWSWRHICQFVEPHIHEALA